MLAGAASVVVSPCVPGVSYVDGVELWLLPLALDTLEAQPLSHSSNSECICCQKPECRSLIDVPLVPVHLDISCIPVQGCCMKEILERAICQRSPMLFQTSVSPPVSIARVQLPYRGKGMVWS